MTQLKTSDVTLDKTSGGSTLAVDLLEGAEAIAEFLYGTREKRRRVYHLAEKEEGPQRIPVFRMGNMLCGRKSTLLRWIAEREGLASP